MDNKEELLKLMIGWENLFYCQWCSSNQDEDAEVNEVVRIDHCKNCQNIVAKVKKLLKAQKVAIIENMNKKLSPGKMTPTWINLVLNS